MGYIPNNRSRVLWFWVPFFALWASVYANSFAEKRLASLFELRRDMTSRQAGFRVLGYTILDLGLWIADSEIRVHGAESSAHGAEN